VLCGYHPQLSRIAGEGQPRSGLDPSPACRSIRQRVEADGPPARSRRPSTALAFRTSLISRCARRLLPLVNRALQQGAAAASRYADSPGTHLEPREASCPTSWPSCSTGSPDSGTGTRPHRVQCAARSANGSWMSRATKRACAGPNRWPSACLPPWRASVSCRRHRRRVPRKAQGPRRVG